MSLDPNPGTATVCSYAFAGALEVVAPTWVLQVNLPSDTSVHPFQDCVMVTPETARDVHGERYGDGDGDGCRCDGRLTSQSGSCAARV